MKHNSEGKIVSRHHYRNCQLTMAENGSWWASIPPVCSCPPAKEEKRDKYGHLVDGNGLVIKDPECTAPDCLTPDGESWEDYQEASKFDDQQREFYEVTEKK